MSSQKFRYNCNDPYSRYGVTGNIVFANGCFDILHPGHVELLETCRRVADGREAKGRVVLGINSDESIRRIKGVSRPILDELSRREVLKALRCVDDVYIFDDDTPYTLISKIKPDIVVKGGDYDARDVVGFGLAPVMIVPFRDDSVSTSKIIERIKNG